jgi:hypothetical protein
LLRISCVLTCQLSFVSNSLESQFHFYVA